MFNNLKKMFMGYKVLVINKLSSIYTNLSAKMVVEPFFSLK